MEIWAAVSLIVFVNSFGFSSKRNSERNARKSYVQDLNLNIQKKQIQFELNRADDLLLNTLPKSIAGRLKSGEKTIADEYSGVTVIFVDIADFTPLSQMLSAIELVEMLNGIFVEFDNIVKRLGGEKIKTIGDAYMCAIGVPTERKDHAFRGAGIALEMQAAAKSFVDPRGEPIQLRIGMHSGNAVAGVIGEHKFAYDLWGDVVNVASRMESHGEIGKIHISEETARQIGGEFYVEERGEIEVKGKGRMKTAWLLERRAQVRTGFTDSSRD